MAIYDVTQSPYNAVSDYDPTGMSGNTDAVQAIGQAIEDAKAAGGGTVYIPTLGSGYYLNSRFDPMLYPNSIFPTLDVPGVKIVGDIIGRGGSKLIQNVDFDLFRIGAGPSAGGGWGGRTSPEGMEIAGLSIYSAKGFYASANTTVFYIYNAQSVEIHNFAIWDWGFAYGVDPANPSSTNKIVFATVPIGYAGAGFPVAKLPRPGVTTDPRGTGYQSADMGRLGLGIRIRGDNNYKNLISIGQVNGTLAGTEVGEYDNEIETPQGCVHKDIIFGRIHGNCVVQFSGDGSNQFIDIYAFQSAGMGFLYLPPSQANAGSAPGYGMSLLRCGGDWNGDHQFRVWDQTSGGQKVSMGLTECYGAGAGAPESNAAPYPTWASGKKGVLFDNGTVNAFTIDRSTFSLNAGDGAEVCSVVGPSKIWDSTFSGNAAQGAAGSGLYVNNNSLGLNIQRNQFNGIGFGATQDYGMYVNNTNITIDIYHGNVATNNTTAQTNLGTMGVPVPTVNADNVP